jgi:predicted enzyme related to lactoylglutathione lyase
MTNKTGPLFRKVDCVQLPVPDLEAGLSFYRDSLGHQLAWRTETAAGLQMPESEAEIVLQTERAWSEVDLLVDNIDTGLERITSAGGSIVAGPTDIPVGRVAVVRDPWKNELVMIQLTARYAVDEAGNVTGVRTRKSP